MDRICLDPQAANPQLEDLLLGGVFRSELALTRAYSPKPTAYGGPEDGLEEDEDEEEVAKAMDGNAEEMSQAGRIWISRIPGLKVTGHSSGEPIFPL